MKLLSFPKIKQIFFYLIILLLPTNLAKHFSQPWSQVNGILVDYLIPTLYLTDILIIIILILWLIEIILKAKKPKLSLKPWILLLFLSLNIIFSFNKPAAIYKSLKILEMVLLAAWMIFNQKIIFKTKLWLKIISLSAIFQSTLAILQWLNQGSILGYLFLGEQPYNSATFNIKLINFFGQLKIPPMATLPHPNVLAGFLVIFLNLILINTTDFKKQRLNTLALILGSISLFLSFSLPAIAVFLFNLIIIINQKISLKKWLFYFLLITNSIFLTCLTYTFTDLSSWQRRLTLNQIALKMWQQNPISGVGLNNFINQIENYGQIILNYRFFQPVHNIYLLTLAETGLIGFSILSLGLLTLATKVKKTKPIYLLTLLNIIILGLFDHYFLTIQQGLLILTLTISLASSTAATTAAAAPARKSARRTNP